MSTLVGIPRAFTFTVASAVFLDTLGSETLPWAYGAGAIAVAGFGILYVWLERKFGLQWVGVIFSLLLAFIFALCGLAIEHSLVVPGVAFGLIVLTEVEFTITNVSFWNVANRTFTVRQASRLFGLVSAGQSLPAILGGLAIPLLVESIPTHALLGFSTMGHLMIAAWMLVAVRVPTSRPTSSGRVQTTAALLRNRYLRWVALLLCIQVFVFYSVDNALYVVLEMQLGQQEQIAAFLGRFLVALGVLSLAFRFGLSSRWRQWLGMRSALLSTPATLFILSLLASVAGSGRFGLSSVLVLVVVLKLWERISVDAIHSPAYYALFLPMPTSERASAQSTFESVIAQAATISTSMLLLLLASQEQLINLLWTIAAATLAWSLVGIWVAENYRYALKKTLASARIEPDRLHLANKTTLDLIARETESQSTVRVLRSLELLDEIQAPDLATIALRLIERADARVVEAAARWLEAHPHPRSSNRIRNRIDRGAPPAAMEALLRAYGAAAGEAAVPLLCLHIDRSLEERAGAAAALLRFGGTRGARSGQAALHRLFNDPSPEGRSRGAEIAGHLGRAEFVGAMLPLLDDRDLSVARTAALSLARLKPRSPLIGSALVSKIGRMGMLTAIQEALHDIGDMARVEIERRIDGGCARPLELLALFDVASYLPDAQANLKEWVKNPHLRASVLAAWTRCKEVGLSSIEIEEALEVELHQLWRLRSAEHHVVSAWPLTKRALREAVTSSIDVCLSLAALLFDTEAILEANHHRGLGTPETEALAIELIEAAVPGATAKRLLPLVDLSTDENTLRRLGYSAEHPLDLADLSQLESHPLLAKIAQAELSRSIPDDIQRLRRVERLPMFSRLKTVQLEEISYRLSGGRGHTLPPAEGPMPRWTMQDFLILTEPDQLSEHEDGSDCVFKPTDLNLMLQDDPDAAWRILESLCERARGRSFSKPTFLPASSTIAPEALRVSEVLERLSDLEKFEAFSETPSRVLTAVAKLAQQQDLSSGHYLVREGELDASLVLLVDGHVTVSRGGALLAKLSAPAIFGELAAIQPAPRSASIIAETPARTLILPREALYSLVMEDKAVLEFLFRLVIARLPALDA